MAQSGTLGGEVEIHSPADKFFNFVTTQLHHVQNITDHVHETKVHQGDWHSVGSDHVKHWTFTVVKPSTYSINCPYIHTYLIKHMG